MAMGMAYLCERSAQLTSHGLLCTCKSVADLTLPLVGR